MYLTPFWETQSDPQIWRRPHQCARFMPRLRQHLKELGDLGGKQQMLGRCYLEDHPMTCKWFITTVNMSRKSRLVPLISGRFMAYKRGLLLTKWDDAPSTLPKFNSEFTPAKMGKEDEPFPIGMANFQGKTRC